MSEQSSVQLAPIATADVPRVADFLHRNHNQRVMPAAWARALQPTWEVAAPNHGFLLHENGRVVGAYAAIYSERVIKGRPEQFCNLAAWCVLDSHRAHGVRLLRALLGQGGYHFTDLSPSGSVIAVNGRLRFQSLDTATALVPNLPVPPWPSRARVITDPDRIAGTLTGDDLRIYEDHRDAPAARHLLLVAGDEHCYVVARKDRRKGLPVFASLLYVGNPAVLSAHGRALFRHLLLRHGALATLAELRVVGGRPRPSTLLDAPRPRMFRSPSLKADDIDYLYSELTLLAW